MAKAFIRVGSKLTSKFEVQIYAYIWFQSHTTQVTTAEVFIRLDPNLKIMEAADIARRTKRALSAGIHDLCSAEVHLGKCVYGGRRGIVGYRACHVVYYTR